MDYDAIATALVRANLVGSPAELHGFLCGEIAGSEVFSEASLVMNVANFLNVHPERAEDLGDTLVDLYEFSVAQIDSSSFEFLPLLPDDDFPLSERLSSLGEWCQGFLYGLGNSRSSSSLETSGDIAEALDDLASISHVQVLDEGESAYEADDEVDYTELVEYIRVAVLTISEELDTSVDASTQSTH